MSETLGFAFAAVAEQAIGLPELEAVRSAAKRSLLPEVGHELLQAGLARFRGTIDNARAAASASLAAGAERRCEERRARALQDGDDPDAAMQRCAEAHGVSSGVVAATDTARDVGAKIRRELESNEFAARAALEQAPDARAAVDTARGAASQDLSAMTMLSYLVHRATAERRLDG